MRMSLAKSFVRALALASVAHAQSAVVEGRAGIQHAEQSAEASRCRSTRGRCSPRTRAARRRKRARAAAKGNWPEGSTVKLGENAKLVIETIDDRGIFRSALSILDGAFRFTTDALRKSQKREVTIKARNVTAGIRGTDLWGKSTDERDLVCLLEGKISVGAEGHPTVTLDQPLDFYQKPRDGAPSVAKVDEKQIAQWSAETEISVNGGPRRDHTREVGRSAPRPSARDPGPSPRAKNRVLRADGYPSEVVVREGGSTVEILASRARTKRER